MEVLSILFLFTFLGFFLGFLLDKICRYYLHRSRGYPVLMGVGNAVFCVAIGMKYNVSLEGLIFCLFSGILFGIAVIDRNLYLIPLSGNFAILCLGMFRFFVFRLSVRDYILGPFCLCLCLIIIYYLTGKRAIGGGDIKFLMASGTLLGTEKVFLALFFACSIALGFQILKRGMGRGDKIIALGPYLSIGSFAALLL